MHTEKFQLTTSRRGRPYELHFMQSFFNFNSRPHEEVDDAYFTRFGYATRFQLTTSRRGRLVTKLKNFVSIIFQLTTSRRGRQNEAEQLAYFRGFQLTTSRRGRRSRDIVDAGVDGISTHDLTKRSTLPEHQH